MPSMLSWIWGSKSSKKSVSAASEVPEGVSHGVQSTLEAEDTLLKREAFLQKKIEKELQCAREANQKGNRTLAMRHLQKKKQMTEELTRIEGHLANLNTMRMKLEEQQMNLAVFKAHQESLVTFKELELDADEVDAQMEKAREAIDKLNEVSERLAQPLDLYDEDELLSELMDFELEHQQPTQQQHQQIHTQTKTRPATVRAVVDADEDDLLLQHQAQMLQA